MNKKFLVISIFLLFTLTVFFNISTGKEETTVITWDEDIILHQDYVVKENQILIIKPGLTVYFDGGTSLIVKGKLEAIGRKNETINFKRNGAGRWKNIYIDEGNATLKYCRVEDSAEGIYCKDSQFLIESCKIAGCIRGIGCIDSEGKILNNTI